MEQHETTVQIHPHILETVVGTTMSCVTTDHILYIYIMIVSKYLYIYYISFFLACEGHVVRSPKHTLHRNSHGSKFCMAAVDLVRHDQRLLCQPVAGPGEDQLAAVEFPHGIENCLQGEPAEKTLLCGWGKRLHTSFNQTMDSFPHVCADPSFWKVVKRILASEEMGQKK